MPVIAGNNVLLPKPGDSREHLWVVLAGPSDDGRVIIANLTGWRPGADTTVEIADGEHPFVSKRTVVFYTDARISEAAHIEAAMRRYPTYQDFEGDLLERLQRGLFLSDKTSDEVKALARDLLPDLGP